MEFKQFANLNATIIGAAREGTALARFLAEQGAHVTLSDVKTAEVLSSVLADLEGLPIHFALGGHPPDLLETDVLFLSPGVPLTAPIVQEARERGIPISSEPRLFTQLCAAPIVGITGSSGKTTTTTLIGRMLEAAGHRVWVGGNIGQPLISRLSEPAWPDAAVMELSSFQLELFHPTCQGPKVDKAVVAAKGLSIEGWSPHIAVITNITPNHLDRHGTMETYIQAKAAILEYQNTSNWAVLNWDNPATRALAHRTPAHTAWFSLYEPVVCGGMLRGETLLLRWQGQEMRLCRRQDIRLRGEHNVANILTAASAALAMGADLEAIRHVATTFQGVPHRLEVVRQWRGITFVNDSIATSPERAIAALRAYDEPIVLLAGGRDKHLPWDEWATWVRRKVRAVITFGECAPLIENALQSGDGVSPTLYHGETLERAVRLAAEIAQPGDIVLLSPGGTSFDAFTDFEARGQAFRELVHTL